MQADVLRKKYLKFFQKKGHKLIPSAPLIPENDPTTLFTSSGMQPLVAYLMGEKHPLGKRLANSQLCFRAEDINEVGDSSHTTFFEMLGNWSLGDYFKKEQLSWFFQFLTKELGLNQERLFVSVFEGNQQIAKDKESIAIWQKLFKTKESAKSGLLGFDPKIKIYTYPVEKNWWSRSGPPEKMPHGEIGGPDSEVFYDFGSQLKLHENSKYKSQPCHLNCQCGRFMEIGNSVFIQYQKMEKGFKKLCQSNVDFGGGLERMLAALNDNPDIFKTSVFLPLIQEIEKSTQEKYSKKPQAMRIIADHLRAAVFLIYSQVEPGNKLQGYLLRRLLRRTMVKMYQLGKKDWSVLFSWAEKIINLYENSYFSQQKKALIEKTREIIALEAEKFSKTFNKGLKIINKIETKNFNAKIAFDLFQSYGFPFEITEELLKEKGISLDRKIFDQEFKKHQKKSRTSVQGIFKGGLADHRKAVVELHTATHLLHSALRKVLGSEVKQVGSNITSQRLRFDFTYHQALNRLQLKEVEELVNQAIKANLKVSCQTMSLKEAQKKGALAFFLQKYPSQVKVYAIGDFSLELCAGPHVDFTGRLGKFRIIKEESVGVGKRRIYAVLE